MTDLFQFGAALVGFLTAVMVAIPTVIQYRLRKRGVPEPQKPRSGRAFAWITRPRSVLIGVAILALISGLLLVQLTDSREEPSTMAESLLSQLADDDAHECRPVKAPIANALASMQCALDEPMRVITMSLFTSTSDLKKVEQDRIAALGTPAGDCTIQGVGWQRWRRGKLFCDYGDGSESAHIQWSRYDSNIWLEAEATPGVSPDRVYDWWNEDDSGALANNRLPYPDRYERYILEAIDMKPGACERVDGYKDSLGSVVCDRRRFKTLFFGYYSDPKSLHEALGVEPGEGYCARDYRYDYGRRSWIRLDGEPGRKAYTLHGEPAGTRDCYEISEDREVVVEWTNQEKGLFGFAKWADSGDLEDLFRWWETNGRYLTD